jgi:hypothetical protein
MAKEGCFETLLDRLLGVETEDREVDFLGAA